MAFNGRPQLEEEMHKMAAEIIGHIKIDKPAYDKAQYISERVCEFMGRPIEVGFYLLECNILAGQSGDASQPHENYCCDLTEKLHGHVSDIYICAGQSIERDSFVVSAQGNQASFSDIRERLGKTTIGIGHSHGTMSTFYSDRDDEYLLSSIVTLGKKATLGPDVMAKLYPARTEKKHSDTRGGSNHLSLSSDPILNSLRGSQQTSEEEMVIRYCYGMTFNSRKDKPFCVAAYAYPGGRRLIKDIGFEVLLEGSYDILNKTTIDNELIDRVEQIHNKYALIRDKAVNDVLHIDNISDRCNSLTRDISLADIGSIIQDPSGLVSKFDEFINNLGRMFIIKDTYNEAVSDPQEVYARQNRDIMSVIRSNEVFSRSIRENLGTFLELEDKLAEAESKEDLAPDVLEHIRRIQNRNRIVIRAIDDDNKEGGS